MKVQLRSWLLGSCVDRIRMDRQFGVDMVRLGSRGMCREDAERVFAGQGEGEGGLLCRRGVCCTLHNVYIEQLDSSVYKMEPYMILSYLL